MWSFQLKYFKKEIPKCSSSGLLTENLRARIFWIKKLNLSHQAWPRRSQPHYWKPGAWCSLSQVASREGKTGNLLPVWALQATTLAVTVLPPHLVSQLCGHQYITEHHLGPLPSARCPVLSGLTLCTPYRKSPPRAATSGNVELSPCYSPHQLQLAWFLRISTAWCGTDTPNLAPALVWL